MTAFEDPVDFFFDITSAPYAAVACAFEIDFEVNAAAACSFGPPTAVVDLP